MYVKGYVILLKFIEIGELYQLVNKSKCNLL